MQLKFFTIPVMGGESAAAELNRFLAAQRILALDRQLMQAGNASAWAVCVSFEPAGQGRTEPAAARKRGKVDYREVLSEANFDVYVRLRTLRKNLGKLELPRIGQRSWSFVTRQTGQQPGEGSPEGCAFLKLDLPPDPGRLWQARRPPAGRRDPGGRHRRTQHPLA